MILMARRRYRTNVHSGCVYCGCTAQRLVVCSCVAFHAALLCTSQFRRLASAASNREVTGAGFGKELVIQVVELDC
jgi:hypothetical protein